MDPDGNDYSLSKVVDASWPVRGWTETMSYLEELQKIVTAQ